MPNISNPVSVPNLVDYLKNIMVATNFNTLSKYIGNLENINDNYEKIVVSLDDVSLGNRNGIRHIPAWQSQNFKQHFASTSNKFITFEL